MSGRQHYNFDVTKLVELSKNDPSLITIEATVITGFESMAMDECQEKCKPSNICRAKGRIYFNIPVDTFSNVLKLRAVDNVFLVNEVLGKIELQKDKEKDLELVQSLVNRVDWKSTLSTWAKLTEFSGILFPLVDPVDKLADDFAKTVLDEKNDNLPGESLENRKIIITSDNTDSEINCKYESNILTSNTNALTFNDLKNESEELQSDTKPAMEIVSDEILVESLKMSPQSPKRRNSASSEDSFYSAEDSEFSTDGAVEVRNTVCEKKLSDKNDLETNQTIDNIQDRNEDKKNTAKKVVDPNVLKFRATCNRTGEHSFSSMEAAAVFGGTLQDRFNWTVNLDNFNLNVILNINSDRCYICSAITPKSLHRRNITHFGYTTLRSTMCYNMIRLAEPAKGEIIIDPLCGGGSIPIEGALSFKNTFHICGDNNDKAMNRTVANINHINKAQPLLVDPLKWSVKRLPLRDDCIDVFVTDLPFGKRSGKKSDNLNLYKKVLSEMARVIRCRSGRAVLLTNDKTSLTRALGGNNGVYWRQINSFGVNQGGLFSTVFLLLRTSKPFLL